MTTFTSMRFDGTDLKPHDHTRLGPQLLRVKAVLLDYKWHTVVEIAESTGDPETSVSAQIRNLRKPRFGGHVIEKRRDWPGLYEFKMEEGK